MTNRPRKVLYFDEAGYTGSNINDKQQPYFCLASFCINEVELQGVTELVRQLLLEFDLPIEELHFVRLKRSTAGRNFIKKLLLTLREYFVGDVLVHVTNKEFATSCLVIDRLVEPLFHYNNVDLYSDKKNVIWACDLDLFLRKHPNQNQIVEFRRIFQDMILKGTEEEIEKFKNVVSDIMELTKSHNFRNMLLAILRALKAPSWFETSDKFTLDVTMSSFVASLEYWRAKINLKFDIVFDNSKPIRSYSEMINKLSDSTIPELMVGYDDRKHQYPLPVNNLELADSKDNIGLQIADILASAFCFIYNKQSKLAKFKEELIGILIPKFVNYGIIYHQALSTLESLETIDSNEDIDSLDYVDSIINKDSTDLKA